MIKASRRYLVDAYRVMEVPHRLGNPLINVPAETQSLGTVVVQMV